MGSSTRKVLVYVLMLLAVQNSILGSALNEEGFVLLRFREGIELDPSGYLLEWGEKEGEVDPCSWNGVTCNGGRVISLCLQNLALKGSLSPEIGKLLDLKYLVLHNNSFYGTVPREFGQLENLEVLDLGYNKFSGSIPADIGKLVSLDKLVIDGNYFLDDKSTLEVLASKVLHNGHFDNDLSSTCVSCFSRNTRDAVRRLQQRRETGSQGAGGFGDAGGANANPPSRKGSGGKSDSVPEEMAKSPSPSPSPPSPSPPPPPPPPPLPPPSQASSDPTENQKKESSSKKILIIVLVIGFSLLIPAFAIFVLLRTRKVTVRPLRAGLTEKLQQALVTGLPKLGRAELEVACEDFSNIIGKLMDDMVYKGTLSSGVEIAVCVVQTDHWDENCQAQFEKKVAILSKVNHKNFVNLIGYCKDEEPMSRMLVFEYAPNGKLFEHLHNTDSRNHLNWSARMRIAMGVAYCLDHMLRLTPPIILTKLDSNSVYLTDDFAPKVADVEFWSETAELVTSDFPIVKGPENVVYLFGTLLLELISGRPPYAEESGDMVFWAAKYLNGAKPLREAIDPAFQAMHDEDINAMFNLAKLCLDSDPKRRPDMDAVVLMLKKITSITPENAYPKPSPLWWAELEIISNDM